MSNVKIALVTEANKGIGFASALTLANLAIKYHLGPATKRGGQIAIVSPIISVTAKRSPPCLITRMAVPDYPTLCNSRGEIMVMTNTNPFV